MPPISDHVTPGVSDIGRARAFYVRAIATLGLPLLWETATMLIFGVRGGEDFGLQLDAAGLRHGTHVAARARDRSAVDRFRAEALAAGGADAGAPGLRPEHAGTSYAAFVNDPDGNRLEAVSHG